MGHDKVRKGSNFCTGCYEVCYVQLHAIMYAAHLLFLCMFGKDGWLHKPMRENQNIRLLSLHSLEDMHYLLCE
jgi:hypothetical protein